MNKTENIADMTHLYEALQRHTVLGAQVLVSGIGDVVRLTPRNLRLRGASTILTQIVLIPLPFLPLEPCGIGFFRIPDL
jgi:hypothetical protein